MMPEIDLKQSGNSMELRVIRRLDEAIKNMVDRVSISDRRAEAYYRGHYPYIPLNNATFQALLGKAKQHIKIKSKHRPRFLDIGCGIGTKVLIASEMGFNASGLEYDKVYYQWAKQITLEKCTKGNALEYTKYGEFDCLYFYCPLADEMGQLALEERIAEQMRPGAVLIAVHGKNGTRSWKKMGLELLDSVVSECQGLILRKEEK